MDNFNLCQHPYKYKFIFISLLLIHSYPMMIQAGKFNDWPSPIQISVAYWMGVFIEFANENCQCTSNKTKRNSKNINLTKYVFLFDR